MKTKLTYAILGLMAALLTMGMGGGCGGAISENNDYYYPSWMPDGRIICEKIYEKSKELAPGKWERIERKYYVTVMNDDGSNEKDLFEVASAIKEITCSPTGELIAYIMMPAGEIVVTDYTGSSKITIPSITNVEYLDWSPDASKIVYTNSSRELHVVNREGGNDNLIASSAEAVAWRVGEKIAFELNEDGSIYISVIDINGMNYQQLHGGQFPQKSNNSTVIFRTAGNVKSINLDGSNYQELFPNYDRSSLKLSFNNTSIVGGDLYQSTIKGIYIVNVGGTNSKQLR